MTALLMESRDAISEPQLSQDGTRVAYRNLSTGDIWIRDLDRNSDTRLTVEGQDIYPTWGLDRDTITFSSDRGGNFVLYTRRADLSQGAEVLAASTGALISGNWSGDGQVFVYYEVSSQDTNRDIWTLSPGSEPTPFLVTPFNERAPQLSPNGEWLAYVSDQSGLDQVYVTPFPTGGSVVPVSTTGGSEARWSRDGRELFYRLGSQMWSVAVEMEPEFSIGRVQLLFDVVYDRDVNGVGNPNYDVSLDGERFLMVQSGIGATVPIHLVQNFFTELERLVPTE